MIIIRALVGAAGVALAAFGVLKLAAFSFSDLVNTAVWLAGGVIAHDAILAPATVVVAAVGLRLLPARFRAPAAGALIVLGTVTLVAVPVLLSKGAKADNPTLLDRDYVAGWWVFAAIVVLGALLVAWRSPRRQPKDG